MGTVTVPVRTSPKGALTRRVEERWNELQSCVQHGTITYTTVLQESSHFRSTVVRESQDSRTIVAQQSYDSCTILVQESHYPYDSRMILV